jgi:catechol 2,3-dioxygenase-like lactoylglutathione lyase family enzyme
MAVSAPVILGRVVPVLLADDLASTLHFYVNTLGFEVVGQHQHASRIDWHFLRRGNAEIMLAESGESPSQIDVVDRDKRSAFYFFAEDLAALRNELVAKSARVSPIRVTPDGIGEFELLDPDGHVLVFGQTMQNAGS